MSDCAQMADLANHPYVERVEVVSFRENGRELLEITFRGTMPEPFAQMDGVSVLTCWIDTVPGWWGTLLGESRARRFGLGSQAIAALVEVDAE